MQWDVHFLQTTESTNADLMKAGRAGAPEGLAEVAVQQTAGRGRMDRSWFSPPGTGLYASVLVRPGIVSARAGLISLCAANAMRAAVAEAGLMEAKVKWPNDLVCGGKKICGILSSCQMQEGRVDFAVIGTGLNLKAGSYPSELSDRAGCLEEMGVSVDRDHLFYQYLRHLDAQLQSLKAGGKMVLEELRSNCITLGKEVRVSGGTEMTGMARDIGRNGELMIELKNGKIIPVMAGDVSVRGLMGYT